MLSKFFVIFSILIFSYSGIYSQNITISGTVKEEVSQAPIAYANVTLKLKTDNTFVTGTATNEDGRYYY